jgi:hypothetical protein
MAQIFHPHRIVIALALSAVLALQSAYLAQAKTVHLQEAISTSTYEPVDRVSCDQLEQTVLHIHAHVSLYINGKLTPLPADVGIPREASGKAICFYWLHTHDASGVIHIEAPVKASFTFGQFRDEWCQKFQNLGFPGQLFQNSGWTIWINGQRYSGTLESIPLAAHSLITLAYNSPKVTPDTHYTWGEL